MFTRLNKKIPRDRYKTIFYLSLFCFLIIFPHFFYRWWARGEVSYWPIHHLIISLYDFLSNLLYINTKWVLTQVTSINFTYDDLHKTIKLSNNYVTVNDSCSGGKQIFQWLMLMIFFPGPWKNKLWFIPIGVILMHIINVLRITTLSVILNNDISQETWEITHDVILRPIFFLGMFILWVIWVEKIIKK